MTASRSGRRNSAAPVLDRTGPEFASLALDRRRFLVLLGGAAAYTALRPHAAWARRLGQAMPVLQPWRLPETLPPSPIEAARALIGAAVLAPSYWNAQPWRFEVDPAEVRMVLDPSRTLPASDPDERFARMSLGAALENMLVAARAWGQQPNVRYLPYGAPRPGQPLVAASITWHPGERPRDRLLYSALAERRTNSRPYDGRAITLPSRSQLLTQASDDVRVHWLDDRADVRAIAGIVHDATEASLNDRRAQAERMLWLRSSDEQSRRRGDGVTPERIGLGGPARWLAGRALDPESHFFGWGASSLAKDLRDLVRSAGAVALFTTTRPESALLDNPSWILAGQAYERFALRAATLGIAQQPLAAPIESERHRAVIARRFGAAGEEPLLLVRLGHAKRPDPTPRRGVALVSTYRTS